jgi:hypothetical protein
LSDDVPIERVAMHHRDARKKGENINITLKKVLPSPSRTAVQHIFRMSTSGALWSTIRGKAAVVAVLNYLCNYIKKEKISKSKANINNNNHNKNTVFHRFMLTPSYSLQKDEFVAKAVGRLDPLLRFTPEKSVSEFKVSQSASWVNFTFIEKLPNLGLTS